MKLYDYVAFFMESNVKIHVTNAQISIYNLTIKSPLEIILFMPFKKTHFLHIWKQLL